MVRGVEVALRLGWAAEAAVTPAHLDVTFQFDDAGGGAIARRGTPADPRLPPCSRSGPRSRARSARASPRVWRCASAGTGWPTSRARSRGRSPSGGAARAWFRRAPPLVHSPLPALDRERHPLGQPVIGGAGLARPALLEPVAECVALPGREVERTGRQRAQNRRGSWSPRRGTAGGPAGLGGVLEAGKHGRSEGFCSGARSGPEGRTRGGQGGPPAVAGEASSTARRTSS